jgi:PKHD-type hydroxylase
MILEIAELLSQDEVGRMREIASRANFLDGRLSNPGNEQKRNLQIDHSVSDYAVSSNIVLKALERSREFRDFALPRTIAPPMMTKYGPGMKYGVHADTALLPMPSGPLRSDVSCTVFLADPNSYEGGELVIHVGDRAVLAKGPAGSAIVYPSTTLHEVASVRSGERLVAITFVQSFVADQADRWVLYELGELSALEGMNMKPLNRMRLEVVRHNLTRKWSR